MSDLRLLSWYAFDDVPHPEQLRDTVRDFANERGLRGRVYVAHEGVNGGLSGERAALEALQKAAEGWQGFAQASWKWEQVDRVPFADLRVKVRKHLVNLGEGNDVDPHREGGERLSPAQWRAFLSERDDYVLLDVRNDYEAEIGHFEGAIAAPYKYFSEFPRWADELDAPRDKPVLMYCTGGIRCEKFSGLLKRRGFKQVYQLDGGVLRYSHEVGHEHWVGRCFVFDDRMAVNVGEEGEDIAQCHRCGAPTSRMLNCANVDCHWLFVCCDDCAVAHQATCSDACLEAPRLREFKRAHLQRPWRRLHDEELKAEESPAATSDSH